MQTFTFASTGRQIDGAGNFIRYERETSAAPDASVRVRVDGNDYGTWLPGDFCELPFQFRTVELSPVAGAVGEFRVGSGRFNSSRFLLTGQPTTNIAATVPARASFTQTLRTVTNATTNLAAANPARDYLLIQNNDATGWITVSFGAAAAVLGTGIRIAAGGFWEFDSAVPTDAVQAIGSAASNPNIVVVEGQ